MTFNNLLEVIVMKDFQLVFSEKQIDKVAAQFLELTLKFRHFAFYGSMGSGKTTFITALCRRLDVEDLVSSPTFSIINEYSTKEGLPVYHFDFYRIKAVSELLDIGFEEYCYNQEYCFIEWPEKAEIIIPDDFLKIYIKEVDNSKRSISFKI
jgi:tRNA threonylcarbamoyladenosine biosynthesis protein TsaE